MIGGGFNLPPGCGMLPGEEPEPPCVDCEEWVDDDDPENQKCKIVPMIESKYSGMLEPDLDMCPKIAMINKCPVCEKEINKLRGEIPKDHWGDHAWEGSIPTCSKECAEEQNRRCEEDIKQLTKNEQEMEEMEKRADEEEESKATLDDPEKTEEWLHGEQPKEEIKNALICPVCGSDDTTVWGTVPGGVNHCYICKFDWGWSDWWNNFKTNLELKKIRKAKALLKRYGFKLVRE